MFEEHGVTSTHIRGLQEIVRLRGGYKFLKSFPKIHFKIERQVVLRLRFTEAPLIYPRLDLSRSLCTGESPLFYIGPVSWEPFFRGTHPIHLDFQETEGLALDGIVSPKLAIIYRDLRALTDLINTKNVTASPVSIELFQSVIHSVQSRLWALQDGFQDDVQECLRLGMLGMLTTTFRLPGRQVPYTHLANQMRQHLRRVHAYTQLSKEIIFWALIMSIIAMFEVEDWMRDVWRRVAKKETSWEDAKARLEGVLWM
jgi:hypothetical protein